MKQDKSKLTKSQVFTKFGQFIYLTINSFNQNNMWESASSCSFGFIFSFVPITMIISTVLIGILKVSPGVYNYVNQFADEIENIVNIRPFISNIVTYRNLTVTDIFLGIWIIWMARRLFNSVVQAMNRIFRSISKRTSWLNQLLTFIAELVLVLVFISMILAAFIFNRFFSLPIFDFIKNSAPRLFSYGSTLIANSVIYILLFIVTFLCYRFLSGTKPQMKICLFYSLINTLAFFILSYFLNHFFNTSRYNVVYGTISTLIILMAKVYFFFTIFLFCAQMIYVSQFFETLLKAEIYLRPNFDEKGPDNSIRRKLFINPSVLQTDQNTIYLKNGEQIYTKNDKTTCVYYIRKGFVSEIIDGSATIYSAGNFFGDLQCILNEDRKGTATATSDCEILVLSVEEFKSLIHENPLAAMKALSKVSEYTASIYEEHLKKSDEDDGFFKRIMQKNKD